MAKISKAVEKKVRDNIMAVVDNICDSALHISAITDSKDIWKATAKLSDAEFETVAGVPKKLWNALERTQNTEWKCFVELAFLIAIEKQAKETMNIIHNMY
jgi:hypothetical protein